MQLDVEVLLGLEVMPEDLVLSLEFIKFVLKNEDALALVCHELLGFVDLILQISHGLLILPICFLNPHGLSLDLIDLPLTIINYFFLGHLKSVNILGLLLICFPEPNILTPYIGRFLSRLDFTRLLFSSYLC